MNVIKKILYVQPFVLDKGGLEDNKIHIAYSRGVLIWAVYLDNYLKSKIHDLESMLLYLPFEEGINIDSYTQENTFFSQMDELISELSFDKKGDIMVCISAPTSHHYLSSKLIASYFQKRFPENVLVVGGVHASVRPNDFIYQNSPFDYIIIGEGELPLYNLIKEKVGKQKTPKIIGNNPVTILNDLPPLDFSLFDKYPMQHLSVNLSRGCPFTCSFCIEEFFCKNTVKKWRAYKPERAVEELNSVIEYGKKRGAISITLNDPIFGFNKRWLEKFTELSQISSIPIWVDTRLEILNEKTLTTLAKKGFFQMYGLETCSKKMLKIMNKTIDPSMYLKKFENLCQIHKKIENTCFINLLFNHPGETKETVEENMNKILNLIEGEKMGMWAVFNFALYTHFPGTRIYKNMENYELQYGTVFYYPEWWKNEVIIQYGGLCVKSSSNMPFRESLDLYSDYNKILETAEFKTFSKNKKHASRRFQRYFEMVKNLQNLETLKSELLTFIEEHPPNLDDPQSL
jgi:radical SAM superfamily enzyme YgiQ (UPF0313 family)